MTDTEKSVALISGPSLQICGISAVLGNQDRFTFEQHNGTLSQINGRAQRLLSEHDLILFRTEKDISRDVQAIDALRLSNSSKATILAISDAETTLADAQLLKRAGVDAVLAETISADELEAEVKKRLASLHAEKSPNAGPKSLGKVVSIAQARGGIGSTMLAVNLADSLAGPFSKKTKTRERNVVVVDLDLQFGSVGGFLDLKPNEALHQIAVEGIEPDATFLSQSIEQLPSGISALASPTKMVPLDALKTSQIRALIETLQSQYDYVVVDLPRAMVDWLSPVLDATDRMLLISDCTIPSIQQARRLIDFYMEDHIGLQIDIVINREKKPLMPGRHHKEAAKILERPFKYWLPFHAKHAREAVDRGVPLSNVARSSALTKAIKHVAATTAKELAHREQQLTKSI